MLTRHVERASISHGPCKTVDRNQRVAAIRAAMQDTPSDICHAPAFGCEAFAGKHAGPVHTPLKDLNSSSMAAHHSQPSFHYHRQPTSTTSKQPSSDYHRSSGLFTPSPPRFNTCVYTIVVLTSACPSSSCTVRMSEPVSSRCVAMNAERCGTRSASQCPQTAPPA